MRAPSITMLVVTWFLALPINDDSACCQVESQLYADAAEADVTTPRRVRLQDNYGDPARFVNFMIRRPPALA